jgi:hypothetical protein
MRALEVVDRPDNPLAEEANRDKAKLTVTPTRVTLKLPEGLCDRAWYADFALWVARQTEGVTKSWRGFFVMTDSRLVLRSKSQEEMAFSMADYRQACLDAMLEGSQR